jgi:hypothetical protein
VVVKTVRVDVIVPLAAGVTDAGARLQVTVALTGEMPQVNPTAELKLLSDVTVIVEVVLFPATVVAEAGDALMLKSSAARTFKV